jgi:hypothetical protein
MKQAVCGCHNKLEKGRGGAKWDLVSSFQLPVQSNHFPNYNTYYNIMNVNKSPNGLCMSSAVADWVGNILSLIWPTPYKFRVTSKELKGNRSFDSSLTYAESVQEPPVRLSHTVWSRGDPSRTAKLKHKEWCSATNLQPLRSFTSSLKRSTVLYAKRISELNQSLAQHLCDLLLSFRENRLPSKASFPSCLVPSATFLCFAFLACCS